MNQKNYVLLLLAIVVVFGLFLTLRSNTPTPEMSMQNTVSELAEQTEDIEVPTDESLVRRVDFAQFDDVYRFSAELPTDWEVEYVPQIRAINIYDPEDPAKAIRDKSQFFLRFFEASRFLTLSTVDIIEQEKTTRLGREAVRYEIVKQPSVADFSHQPVWRNQQHKLIDIRFTKNSPSPFYVHAYNPGLSSDIFEKFIDSIIYHNDSESFKEPISRASERVTKKPFGLFVTPDNSPLANERFEGWHTGTDFEVFNHELEQPVGVSAICGGQLRSQRQASGYGGLAVQECLLGDEPITVIYGHLQLESIDARVGGYLAPGAALGLLGADRSNETDGERKHLHLGIHKGPEIDIRGYTDDEADLTEWLDVFNIIGF